MPKVDSIATHYKLRHSRDRRTLYNFYLITELISMPRVDGMATHYKQRYTWDERTL